MTKEITETMRAGIWLSANSEGWTGSVDIPDGTFAAVVTANDAWFVVDPAGNVRGDPEAVEREALALSVDQNLIALGALGLARLARRKIADRK